MKAPLSGKEIEIDGMIFRLIGIHSKNVPDEFYYVLTFVKHLK